MKSIKILALVALCTLTFSCKKKEEVTDESLNSELVDSTSTVAEALAHDDHDHAEDALLKETQSKPLTTIALSESDYAFGNIKKGDKKEHIYEVTNTGQNPLIISNVKPGCGCTAPDYTKDPILPGQKGKITLHFDSTSFDGAVSKYADVYMNVEKAPVRLTFSANITP